MSAYNKKVNAANAAADAIDKSTVFQYAMDGLQEIQVQNQAQIKEGQARTKLDAATGEAAGAAASGGVTGNSVQELFRTYAVATGKDISNIRSDAEGQIAQGEAQKKGQQMSAQNQILNIAEGLPDNPSNAIVGNFIAAGLGIAKDYMADTTSTPGRGIFGRSFG
ncbi:hypothetical protein SAMN02745126_04006 [Enhydrobacter aerosaccus]|uniref:Uncharacterized protein n=2 Tax=Enhydrobacter aerosaccus TaxID=225324 RepID=A0A1T4RP98_9HYPH|nr:hypothetical protein [Enhydrobacter aerosaccus]SKA17784.1 hypothetical protein SAMN02745126_04006 [Enhydrobacter aerosaccus]